MLAFLWIAAAILIVIIAFANWRSMRPAPVRLIPYAQIRRRCIEEEADEHAIRPDPPTRPPGINTRLPMHKADALAAAVLAESPLRFKPDGSLEFGDDPALDITLEVYESISAELQAIDPDRDWYELLSPIRRAWLLAWHFDGQVNNGGFDQYYLNSSGDGAADAPEALHLLDHPQAAAIIERCNAVFPNGPPRDRHQRLAAMAKLPDSARELWNAADAEYYALPTPDTVGRRVFGVPFILAHRDEFFKDS